MDALHIYGLNITLPDLPGLSTLHNTLSNSTIEDISTSVNSSSINIPLTDSNSDITTNTVVHKSFLETLASFTTWNIAALGVSVVAMISKELLFRYTLKAGKAAQSTVVITNAYQHRADVGVSMGIFCGVCGGLFGYPLLDPLAGLLVSGMIARQVC